MRLWQLHNFTPFEVAAQFDKDHRAASHWGVWIKATFDIGPEGRLRLADTQRPLVTAPQLSTDGQMTLEDAELTLPKAQTDIILEAQGSPPKGTAPDAPYDVALGVGDWSKRLTVAPAQRWVKRITGGSMQPLPDTPQEIALDYTSGYGGTVQHDGAPVRHEPNPAGQGFTGPLQNLREITAPRLFYPGEDWRGRKSTPRAAGFGPIARHWLDRAALAGTFDEEWMQLRAPLLPTDHDPAWRQSAPVDQRYDGHLTGGETVTFSNIKDGVDLVLPTLRFDVSSHFRKRWTPHDMTLQTLFLRPDAGQLTLTWCGTLPIGAAGFDVALRETHVSLTASSGFAVDPARVAQFHQSGAA